MPPQDKATTFLIALLGFSVWTIGELKRTCYVQFIQFHDYEFVFFARFAKKLKNILPYSSGFKSRRLRF